LVNSFGLGHVLFGPKKFLKAAPFGVTLASAMRTLELDQQANGQWRYRVTQTLDRSTRTLVDWQWGFYDEKETIKQAEERFGKCEKVIVLDWI
jgi:transposase InsO family protein